MHYRYITFLPEVSAATKGGGLFIGQQLANSLGQHRDSKVFYYREIHDLDKFLHGQDCSDCCFIVTWSPHMRDLLRKLEGSRIVYLAQSAGWNFSLPAGIPIISVSRFLQSYWAQKGRFSPIFCLPNPVSVDLRNIRQDRDIDVLCFARKTSGYVREKLLPALSRHGAKVHIQDAFIPIEEVHKLYGRSKVFLYDSSEHVQFGHQWVEGFGIPPLEALLHGCIVYSNLHGGLSDHQDPGVLSRQIRIGSLNADTNRILNDMSSWSLKKLDNLRELYSYEKYEERLGLLFECIEEYFMAPLDLSSLETERELPRRAGHFLRHLRAHLTGLHVNLFRAVSR